MSAIQIEKLAIVDEEGRTMAATTRQIPPFKPLCAIAFRFMRSIVSVLLRRALEVTAHARSPSKRRYAVASPRERRQDAIQLRTAKGHNAS